MKSLNIYAAIFFSIFTFGFCTAQTAVKKDSVKVWGNCDICKKKIERSARSAGATFASWNEGTKMLAVTYNSTTTGLEKIQKSVAASGYDTQDFKANDNAYKKLDPCCRYPRKDKQ